MMAMGFLLDAGFAQKYWRSASATYAGCNAYWNSSRGRQAGPASRPACRECAALRLLVLPRALARVPRGVHRIVRGTRLTSLWLRRRAPGLVVIEQRLFVAALGVARCRARCVLVGVRSQLLAQVARPIAIVGRRDRAARLREQRGADLPRPLAHAAEDRPKPSSAAMPSVTFASRHPARDRLRLSSAARCARSTSPPPRWSRSRTGSSAATRPSPPSRCRRRCARSATAPSAAPRCTTSTSRARRW